MFGQVVTMPWGKHRGERISTIETGYLVWVLENGHSVSFDLRTAIRRELRERFGFDDPPLGPIASCRRPCPDPQLARELVGIGLKRLALRHHPDIGGDTAVMQAVNRTVDWLKAVIGT